MQFSKAGLPCSLFRGPFSQKPNKESIWVNLELEGTFFGVFKTFRSLEMNQSTEVSSPFFP